MVKVKQGVKQGKTKLLNLQEKLSNLSQENLELRLSNFEFVRTMTQAHANKAISESEAHNHLKSNISLLMEQNHSRAELNSIREEVLIIQGEVTGAMRLLGNLSESLIGISKRLNTVLLKNKPTLDSNSSSSPQDKRVNRSHPVSPMVSGHVIQKPTVSLRRIPYPNPVIKPGTIGRELVTLSPIQEEGSENKRVIHRRGRLGRRRILRVGGDRREELLLPVVRLRMLSNSWLLPQVQEPVENTSESEVSEEVEFRGWGEEEINTEQDTQPSESESQQLMGVLESIPEEDSGGGNGQSETTNELIISGLERGNSQQASTISDKSLNGTSFSERTLSASSTPSQPLKFSTPVSGSGEASNLSSSSSLKRRNSRSSMTHSFEKMVTRSCSRKQFLGKSTTSSESRSDPDIPGGSRTTPEAGNSRIQTTETSVSGSGEASNLSSSSSLKRRNSMSSMIHSFEKVDTTSCSKKQFLGNSTTSNESRSDPDIRAVSPMWVTHRRRRRLVTPEETSPTVY